MKKTILSCLTFLLLLPAGYASAELTQEEAIKLVDNCAKKCSVAYNKTFSGLADYQAYNVCLRVCGECLTNECAKEENNLNIMLEICNGNNIIKKMQNCILNAKYKFEEEECSDRAGKESLKCQTILVPETQKAVNQCHMIQERRFDSCANQFLTNATPDLDKLKSMTECANQCEETHPVIVDRQNCIKKCGWINK